MARMHAHVREEVEQAKVAAVLESQGYRYAGAIAAGALATRITTIALARDAGLISPVDTKQAREKGLLQ